MSTEIVKGSLGHLKEEVDRLIRANPWAKDAAVYVGQGITFESLKPGFWHSNSTGQMSDDNEVQFSRAAQHFNFAKVETVRSSSGDVSRLQYFGKTTDVTAVCGADHLLEELNAMQYFVDQTAYIVKKDALFNKGDKLLCFPPKDNRAGAHHCVTAAALKKDHPAQAALVDSDRFMALFEPSSFSHQAFVCKHEWSMVDKHLFPDPFAAFSTLEAPKAVTPTSACAEMFASLSAEDRIAFVYQLIEEHEPPRYK